MEKQPARDKEQTRRAKRPLRPIDAPSEEDKRSQPDKGIGEVPRTRTEMPPRLSELPG